MLSFLAIIPVTLIDQTFSTLQFVVDCGLEIQSGILSYKGPVGMFLFQSLQCRPVALRELLDVHIDTGGIFLCQHNRRSGIHAVQFFPFQKTFIRACQIIPGDISLVDLALYLGGYFFPDLIVFIHRHIPDLHHLSTGHGDHFCAVFRRFRTDRQIIAQIDQCHDLPVFYDILQSPSCFFDPCLIFFIQCMRLIGIALVGEYKCRQENCSQKCQFSLHIT